MESVRTKNSRPTIGYIMSRFPKVTETFILREIRELERQGQPVVILPLIRSTEFPVHPAVAELESPIVYTPFFSLTILSANLHFLRKLPIVYIKLALKVILGNISSPKLLLGALMYFPKSVYFARLVAEMDVEHIHAHFATHPALAAFIISELTDVGFSVTVHAHDIFVHRGMLGEKLRRAQFVVAISKFNKQYLIDRFPVLEKKIEVIHCGVETSKYRGPRDENVTTGRFEIVSVASLQPYKGLEFLIRACAVLREQIPGLHCTVIGEGVERDRLEKLIAKLDLSTVVTLAGARPEDEVAASLARADLFVLPSVVARNGQMEGIPCALMEAMASGLAVVSTTLSGIPELVKNRENGLLVEPENVNALASAVHELYRDPSLRRKFGTAGKVRVESEFEVSRNVAKLRDLLTSRGESGSMLPELVLTANRFNDASIGNFIYGVESPLNAFVRGKDSVVAAARIPSSVGSVADAVIVKLHRPSDAGADAREKAENEYRSLCRLWEGFRDDELLRVPRPISFEAQHAAVVLEKCDGIRLDHMIRFNAIKPRRPPLSHVFSAAGRWLAKLHTNTARRSPKEPVIKRLEREFALDLEQCKRAGLDRPLLDNAETYFQKNLDRLGESSLTIVDQHCDFGPHNIFFNGKVLTVIDFEGMQDGFIYDDISYFISMIEMIPFYHLGNSQKRRLCGEFLENYCKSIDVNQELLRFYKVPMLVKQAAHNPVFGRKFGPTDSARALWRRRAYEARLRILMVKG